MAIIFAKAPGKIILFGEHAVVYGQPAIAIPVNNVSAGARIFPQLDSPPGEIRIHAPDINLDSNLEDMDDSHPLAKAVRLTLDRCSPVHIPPFTLQVSSTIPISAGMGSSAAISVAIIQVLSAFFGHSLSPDEISDLAYEVEKLHHGTPSGIDNKVISHQKPVYFVREQPMEFLDIKKSTLWLIADTGEKTPTYETVSAVQALFQEKPEQYQQVFDQIGLITKKAKDALINGDSTLLGQLMNANQSLLEQLEVSSIKIENLINAALNAGALGAKLSGGGRGGNVIVLVEEDSRKNVAFALIQAGAQGLITTQLPGSRSK
jgi:mevalonate kinase